MPTTRRNTSAASGKSLVSEAFTGFLLRRIDAVPAPIIRAQELRAFPRTAVKPFIDWGILIEAGAPEAVTCYHPCHKCDEDLSLQRDGRAFVALCPLNEWPATPMAADEVGIFKVSIDQFARTLRQHNRWNGEVVAVDEHLYSLGWTFHDAKRVAMVLFIRAEQEAKAVLLSLGQRLPGRWSHIVVLTPTASVRELDFLGQLEASGISVVALDNVVTKRDRLTIALPPGITEGRTVLGPPSLPVLSQKQARDRDRWHYRCRDALTFTGRVPWKRSNEVVVNDTPVMVPNALMLLLLRLVQELRKGDGGWVHVQTLRGDEIVGEDENAPARAAGLLAERLRVGQHDPSASLIENVGTGAYRVSTHPEFIRYRGITWLKLYNRVRAEVDEERERRGQLLARRARIRT